MRVSRSLEYGSMTAAAAVAHDPARGTPLTLLVTGMLDVLVTSIETVKNE